MKTIKSLLSIVLAFVIGVYAVPMYNTFIIENERMQQERILEQKRIERAIKDSKRGLLGKIIVVPLRDLINRF